MLLLWLKCDNLICMTVKTFQDDFILKAKKAISNSSDFS